MPPSVDRSVCRAQPGAPYFLFLREGGSVGLFFIESHNCSRREQKMDETEIRAAGRFPVTSGPDKLDLLLTVVDPICMGMLREIVIRIRTNERTEVSARGRVLMLEQGTGEGLFNFTIEDLSGRHLHVVGYNPKHRWVMSCSWTNTFLSPTDEWEARQSARLALDYEIPRDILLSALSNMHSIPWPQHLKVLGIKLPSDEPILLQDINRGIPGASVTLYGGILKASPFGVYREGASSPLLMQFTGKRGHVFHGQLNLDHQLEWIALGCGWSHVRSMG
ncbi:MAG: hypothetical protein HQ488_01780 [Parcubacteria group bacterium]|nr:hypothetical protein [Parcubacteria group bacterium]